MRPHKTIIVDDEPPACSRLRQLVKSDPELVLAGEAASGHAALELIRRAQPALLFLDVEMPEATGTKLLASLPPGKRPATIFVTAFDQYALAAFDLHAIDYLVKPFTDERWRSAVARVKSRIGRAELDQMEARIERALAAISRGGPTGVRPGDPVVVVDRLAVRVSGEVHFIKLAEIRWIEGAGDYLRLHCRQGTPLIRDTFKELMPRLDVRQFVRIHKSAAINVACVARLRPAASGDYEVELDDGTVLTVSRVYRESMLQYRDIATGAGSG
jgi:two-component system LytT family response regulator